MKEFKNAKMDKWTLFYTVFFAVFSVVVLYFTYQSSAPKIFVLIPFFILFGAFLVSYLLIPKIYLNKENLIIKNIFVTINVPFESISYIQKNSRIGMNFRSFGVGGIFGFFGYFNWNETWYVTNIYKKVKITMKSGKIYMLSPENTEDFLQEINNLKSNI